MPIFFTEKITDEGDGYDISEKTLRHTIHDVHKLTVGQTSSSKPEMIRGLPWRILVMPRPGQENKKQFRGGHFVSFAINRVNTVGTIFW